MYYPVFGLNSLFPIGWNEYDKIYELNQSSALLEWRCPLKREGTIILVELLWLVT